MASNVAISRYRPALCVLAALAAGYTIYYVHTTQQASEASQGSPQTLRRQRANNRRRARPPQIEELIQARAEVPTAYADFHKTSWDAETFLDAWWACSEDLGEAYLLQQKHWPSRDVPATLPLRKRPPSLESLTQEFGVSEEDAKTILQDYEETLLRTFVCQKVPPKCVLEEPEGQNVFVEIFAAAVESLKHPDTLKLVIQLFNAGAYDRLATRKEMYDRYNVQPPEIESVPILASMEQDSQGLQGSQGLQDIGATTDDEDDASRSVHSWHEDADADESKKEGAQPLLNMLYHIAEEQSRREGFVHSGIRCQNCHSGPIRGFRYKCINCVDFDLCEVCETMQLHPKTHLFLKIRIPTPAHAISRRPQVPWYPGKTIGLPNNLKSQHNKLLSEESGFTEYKIDALWEQFKNLAATPWPEDPLGFCWAIDQTTFHKSFSLNMSPVTQRASISLVYDRIFRLHDSNRDGLIGFEEFVHGMAILRSKNIGKRMRKTFEGFDFDEDGYISRKDVLAIFKACYALSQELARDLFAEFEVDLMEGGSLRDNIVGTQPLSAAFTGSFGNSTNHRVAGQGKVRDANGDLMISDSGGILSLEEDDEHDLTELIADLKEIAAYGDIKDSNFEAFGGSISSSEISGHDDDSDETSESIVGRDSAQPGDADIENDTNQQLSNQEDNSQADNSHTNDAHSDRRWVLSETTSHEIPSQPGRETIRQHALTDRMLRKEFYDDETCETLAMKENPSEKHSDTPLQSKIPPPMPENLGQEILFQITQECINELIDPLFREREDLTLCFEHFKTYIELCDQHLVGYATPLMRKELNTESARRAMKMLSAFELQHYLKVRATGPRSYGLGDNHPLIAYFQTLDDTNSLNYKEVGAEELQIVSALKNSQENSDETQPTPSLGSDTSQPDESEPEFPAMTNELHESVHLFDQNDNTALEEDISKQSLNNLLEESGYSIIPEMSILSTSVSVSQTSEESALYRDPTLPQNRPNSIHEPINKLDLHDSMSSTKDDKVKLPKPFNRDGNQYIPKVSEVWNNDFKAFLHFLHVLQRAHEDDLVRGGAGKIDFKEFSDIVTGSAARDLEFLGQWIDM